MDLRATQIAKAFRFINTLCSDGALRRRVGKSVDKSMFVNTVLFQIAHNPLGDLNVQLSDKNNEGVEIVLRTLEIMNKLQVLVPGMPDVTANLLEDKAVVPYLALGLTSTDKDRVQSTLLLLRHASSLTEFPSAALGNTVVLLNCKNCFQSADEPSELRAGSSYVIADSNKMPDCKESYAAAASTSSCRPGDIDRKMSVFRGAPSSQSISKPDKSASTKIKNPKAQNEVQRQASERSSKTENLSDAKNLALEQADRLVAKYRTKKLKMEEELKKVRQELNDAKSESTGMKDQMESLEKAKQRLSTNLAEMQRANDKLEKIANKGVDMNNAYDEQAAKLEEAKKNVDELKEEQIKLEDVLEKMMQHNEAIKTQHQSAMQQLKDLESERALLVKELKQRDVQISEFSLDMKRNTDSVRKMETDRDDLDDLLQEQRSDLSRANEKKKKLISEIKLLQLQMTRHEQELQKKDDAISKLKTELKKHSEVSQLIHSLSGHASGVSINEE